MTREDTSTLLEELYGSGDDANFAKTELEKRPGGWKAEEARFRHHLESMCGPDNKYFNPHEVLRGMILTWAIRDTLLYEVTYMLYVKYAWTTQAADESGLYWLSILSRLADISLTQARKRLKSPQGMEPEPKRLARLTLFCDLLAVAPIYHPELSRQILARFEHEAPR